VKTNEPLTATRKGRGKTLPDLFPSHPKGSSTTTRRAREHLLERLRRALSLYFRAKCEAFLQGEQKHSVSQSRPPAFVAKKQNVAHVFDTRLAPSGQSPEAGSADHHCFGSQGQRLDHVTVAPDPTVEQDLDLVADGLGECLDRVRRLIRLSVRGCARRAASPACCICPPRSPSASTEASSNAVGLMFPRTHVVPSGFQVPKGRVVWTMIWSLSMDRFIRRSITMWCPEPRQPRLVDLLHPVTNAQDSDPSLRQVLRYVLGVLRATCCARRFCCSGSARQTVHDNLAGQLAC
jgi:hypothetical protein